MTKNISFGVKYTYSQRDINFLSIDHVLCYLNPKVTSTIVQSIYIISYICMSGHVTWPRTPSGRLWPLLWQRLLNLEAHQLIKGCFKVFEHNRVHCVLITADILDNISLQLFQLDCRISTRGFDFPSREKQRLWNRLLCLVLTQF